MSIFYCLNFLDSPNLEGQVPVFISPSNRVAQFYPWALGVSQRQSVGQHILVSGTHLGPATYFSPSLFDYF
jgi:hypothetical protein